MNNYSFPSLLCIWMISFFALSFAAANPSAADVANRASAQTIYVPSYARVLTKDGSSQPMASTLVVHNVDPEASLSVTKMDYYSKTGELLKSYVGSALTLSPFQSTHALVPIDSLGAGIGANFIVTWSSDKPVLPPIVEAVMVGGTGTQGISFVSQGRVIAQQR